MFLEMIAKVVPSVIYEAVNIIAEYSRRLSSKRPLNTMAENRMVKLKSFDERIFDVDEAVASEWMAVKNMMEDTGMNAPVQLSNVSSEILEVVIKYCEYHVAFRNRTSEDKSTIKAEEAQKWDAEFIQKVDQQTLFELILVG